MADAQWIGPPATATLPNRQRVGLGPQGARVLPAAIRARERHAAGSSGEALRIEPDTPRPIVVRNETGVEGFGDSIAAAQADLDQVVADWATLRAAS